MVLKWHFKGILVFDRKLTAEEFKRENEAS
jgi:hypothetical protein